MNKTLLRTLLGLCLAFAFCVAACSEPPSTPVVSDDGAYTLTPSIHATWSSSHPNGIDEYLWGISQSKEYFPDVTGWMSVGQDTEATFESAGELERGSVYYVMVAARSGSQWSSIGYSDGIMWVRGPLLTVAQAKSTLADGFALAARPVTAVFADVFYVQEPDCSMGIAVKPYDAMPPGFKVGDMVEVAGGTEYLTDWEHAIWGLVNIVPGTRLLAPMGMRPQTLGGGDWCRWGSLQSGQKGVVGGTGLNNIGLLVRTWGKYTKTGDNTFTVDDGSGIGVKCVVPPGVTLSPTWSYVGVTGISSCERIGQSLYRLLRVRKQSDIIPH